MLNKGDKIKLVNPMGIFDNIGEKCEVIDIDNGMIAFRFGGCNLGYMSFEEFEKYFEKVIPLKVKVRKVRNRI